MMPLVAKYGAAVVAISNDETGISMDPNVRFEVAKRIVERAADFGIPASDVIVDPLVMPIGALGQAGQHAFQLIRRLRDELKVNTICGALPFQSTGSSCAYCSSAPSPPFSVLVPASPRSVSGKFLSRSRSRRSRTCRSRRTWPLPTAGRRPPAPARADGLGSVRPRPRRVHLVQRDAVEERVHVALVGDRDAHLADLAARQLVVGVVAGLGGQVERDREPGLALFEVLAVELVRVPRGGVPRVGPHHPRPVRLVEPVVHPVNCMVRPRLGRPIDVRHLGRERVICAFEIDGWVVDPGPTTCARRAAGGPRRRAAAGPASYPHPPRSRRRDGRSRAALPGPARSTCTSAARRTWWIRRSCSPARSACTATRWTSCGASSPRCPSATSRR